MMAASGSGEWGRREHLGDGNVLNVDRGLYYIGVYICQNLENGVLQICTSHHMQILPQTEL